MFIWEYVQLLTIPLYFSFVSSFVGPYTSKIPHSSRLFQLRRPSDYNNHEDIFDRFEKYSLEQDVVRQHNTLLRIHEQLNDIPPVVELDWTSVIQYIDSCISSNNLCTEEYSRFQARYQTSLEKEFHTFATFSSLYKGHIIDFDTFYKWKEENDIYLNVDETYDIYKMVLSSQNHYFCTVTDFIMINFIIDNFFL